MLNGHLYTAPPEIYGFDTNCPLTSETAQQFSDAGYSFAIRYVARETPHAGDLTTDEAQAILDSGMGLMAVQHYEGDGWTPTDQKGRDYGQYAADACRAIGLPDGTSVFLDLESVSASVAAEQTIRYCNYWHDHVAASGYEPGVYVGYGSGLNPDQLYRRLRATRFWGALNLNSDEFPSVRGLCMKQHECKPGDRPDGCTIEIDTNVVTGDALGGFPSFIAPEGWST